MRLWALPVERIANALYRLPPPPSWRSVLPLLHAFIDSIPSIAPHRGDEMTYGFGGHTIFSLQTTEWPYLSKPETPAWQETRNSTMMITSGVEGLNNVFCVGTDAMESAVPFSLHGLLESDIPTMLPTTSCVPTSDLKPDSSLDASSPFTYLEPNLFESGMLSATIFENSADHDEPELALGMVKMADVHMTESQSCDFMDSFMSGTLIDGSPTSDKSPIGSIIDVDSDSPSQTSEALSVSEGTMEEFTTINFSALQVGSDTPKEKNLSKLPLWSFKASSTVPSMPEIPQRNPLGMQASQKEKAKKKLTLQIPEFLDSEAISTPEVIELGLSLQEQNELQINAVASPQLATITVAPGGKRRRRHVDRADPRYSEMRRRNNVSSARCRENRRQKQLRLETALKEQEDRRKDLMREKESLERQLQWFRPFVVKFIEGSAKGPIQMQPLIFTNGVGQFFSITHQEA
ncbi:unnamed protein product [Darwinula stevensoni]|uniref:BZIP domain-containing protein n=1 Tax=Darwinula stevensoni TaxID=69355 RepID=A0A7R8XIR4_9CRUS|nr:unnamed protein product [Darwinula stevensoni]CAG0894099.1 unnamed protein product [Darwinula stevensoni]